MILDIVTVFTYFFVLIQSPPAQYDVPNPGMVVQYATPEQITRYCGHPLALACAYMHEYGTKCTIILPHGTEKGSPLYRHERAHCNGWPAHH